MATETVSLTGSLPGVVRQLNPTVLAEGEAGGLAMSRLGQLFTADWRERLLLAGCCYNLTVGGVTAGAAELLVTGGGAGTTIDSDQPEIIVGVPTGYYMIPLRFLCSARADLDADGETGQILFFADTTQTAPATATATAGTPTPLLGGGKGAIARAWHTVTADITDPVVSNLLSFETLQAADAGTAASQQIIQLRAEYQPLVPPIFKGPCSLVACWGGTAAVGALASLDWAEIPAAWVEL